MEDFIKGDVVTLKSGGPRMTVGAVESATHFNMENPPMKATCYWFVSHALEQKDFPFEVLQKEDA